MSRLVLLNGVPGVGKSTTARRWATERPGTLVCDIHLLRTWVGAWRERFVETGAAVRPAAQGLIRGYLASDAVRRLVEEAGGDAVLAAYATRLDALVAARPATIVVDSVEGDPDGTYASLVRALGE